MTNLTIKTITKLSLALLLVTALWQLYAPLPAYASGPIVDTAADDDTLNACTAAANDCSLRGAIASATDGDTITFAADYTIVLSSSLGALTLDTQILGIDASSQTVTISGQDTNPDTRIFDISNGVVTLTNLSIFSATGEGIYHDDGSLNIHNSTVAYGSNTGIYNNDGTLRLERGYIHHNHNSGDVAGALNNRVGGTATISGTVIINNQANFDGGGIENRGTVFITNTTVSSNSVIFKGGGFHSIGGSATIINSTFSHNTGGNGAGITVQSGSHVLLTNTTIVSNTGRGIYVFDSSLVTTTNSLLAYNDGNCASDPISGGYNLIDDDSCDSFTNTGDRQNVDVLIGALAANGGPTVGANDAQAMLTHALPLGSLAIDAGTCTVSFDQRAVARPNPVSASCDIGAYESAFLPSADLYIQKSVSPLIAGPGDTITYTVTFVNQDQQTASDITLEDIVPTALTNLSYQTALSSGLLITPTAGTTYAWTLSDVAQFEGGIVTITGQIKAGEGPGLLTNTATITAPNDVTPYNNSADALLALCDFDITVSNANDSGTGSLRQAIADACTSGTTIGFDNDYAIYLDSELALTKSLTIEGTGFDITLSGDTGNDGSRNVRIFAIDAFVSVTLNYLSIVSGTATDGGGISNLGQLTINNLNFLDNVATDEGGAIYNEETPGVIINNSLFAANIGAEGGAINNYGTPLTITASTFFSNSATSDGGALFHSDDYHVQIHNSTFAANTAANLGGGIYNDELVTINNSTFSANAAGNLGGGIYNDDTLTISNTLIANSLLGGDCLNNGVVNDGGYNLIEDSSNACGLTNGTNNNTIGLDPLLADLADYGGQTETYALLPGSPALDAGNNSSCETSDQRGFSRVGACDIGAFESQGFYLSISGGNNQTTAPETTFSDPLSVTLTANVISEPVGSGYVITFTAPGSGASLITPTLTATTNSTGQAAVSASANSIVGTYTITATAAIIDSSVFFSLTNGNNVRYFPIVVKE